jgi:hypothetical protein
MACRAALLASLTFGVPTHGLVRPPAFAAPLARALAEDRRGLIVSSTAAAEPIAAGVGFSTWAAGPDAAVYIMSSVERARTVAQAMSTATFCTACKNQDGAPFGSHVDYILDAKGWPVLLLSDQALHTKNVEVDFVVVHTDPDSLPAFSIEASLLL